MPGHARRGGPLPLVSERRPLLARDLYGPRLFPDEDVQARRYPLLVLLETLDAVDVRPEPRDPGRARQHAARGANRQRVERILDASLCHQVPRRTVRGPRGSVGAFAPCGCAAPAPRFSGGIAASRLELNEGVQFQLLVESRLTGEADDAQRRLVFENDEPITIKLDLLMAELEKPANEDLTPTPVSTVAAEKPAATPTFSRIATQTLCVVLDPASQQLHAYFPVTFSAMHFCQLDVTASARAEEVEMRTLAKATRQQRGETLEERPMAILCKGRSECRRPVCRRRPECRRRDCRRAS
ncbi:hypothetical protein M885DRAFT_232125 [Pelagophyceae sp. CCMP2097]|nr:hypothetical protein M885DRAFT_232125 [Pelagophyceae sp. CCMP2097]